MYTPNFTIIPCVLVVSRDTIRHAWTSFCFTGCQILWVQFKEECCWILWKIYFWSFDNSPHWFPEWLYQLIIPALSKGSSPRRICCWLLLLLIASLAKLESQSSFNLTSVMCKDGAHILRQFLVIYVPSFKNFMFRPIKARPCLVLLPICKVIILGVSDYTERFISIWQTAKTPFVRKVEFWGLRIKNSPQEFWKNVVLLNS